MSKGLFSEFRQYDLNSLADKLHTLYYTCIGTTCGNTIGMVDALEEQTPHESIVLYLSLSRKLLEQVGDIMLLRREILVPYIKELHAKETSGHDCSTCKGGCNIKHNAQLTGLKDSHKKIKELLYRLHMVALPLYSETDFPEQYEVLRNEMASLDTVLTELFYIEEASLAPKIMEAQKHIHAYN